MFGAMLDYQFYTGDKTYNDVIYQAMLHQVGDDRDFMPDNQTNSLGNDDQGFWTLTAMMAAENNFQNPPEDEAQWLALVQAVFNEYLERWEEETVCSGGLRWQIFPFNNGFNYKNTISNGCFFNIASRLARYTGNETYAEWAEKIWDWMEMHEFIDKDFNVYDGANIDNECNNHDKAQWTYNAGIFLQGAAMMYNFTDGDEEWKSRVDGLLRRSSNIFFENNVAHEPACEPIQGCNIDQQTFKGYMLRWMASTAQVAPHTFELIMPLIQGSAEAAALQCSGTPSDPQTFKGMPGTACGFSWKERENFDGIVGVGEQMSALSAIQYTLVKQTSPGPVTADNGGTSKGNPNAGASTASKIPAPPPITTSDRVAAGFLTTAVSLGVLAGVVFLMKDP